MIPAKGVGGATWVYGPMGETDRRSVEGDRNQLRVLLMEGDPALGDSLERMLARRGHYVVGASSSVEAERILEMEGIDVVVAAVDPAAPRNGVELLALVMERLPFVRCVGLTGAAAGPATSIDDLCQGRSLCPRSWAVAGGTERGAAEDLALGSRAPVFFIPASAPMSQERHCDLCRAVEGVALH